MGNQRGDAPCAECGTQTNPVWFTDSALWNWVVRREGDDAYGYAMARWGHDPILCLRCFVLIAEERGYDPPQWRLVPQWIRVEKPKEAGR